VRKRERKRVLCYFLMTFKKREENKNEGVGKSGRTERMNDGRTCRAVFLKL
jgi:hypothetical protein